MSSVVAELIVIGILILLNGLLAMTEIALVAARKSRLRSRADQGDVASKVALDLASHPERFLSAIQVGITLIGVLAGAFAGATVADRIAQWLREIPWLAPKATAISLAAVVAVVTYFSLILGELVPKQIALKAPESISRMSAHPMKLLATIAAPMVWLLALSTRAVLALLRIHPEDGRRVTEEDLRLILREGLEEGVLEPIEADILQRAARLDDIKAARMMTRRPDIVWLDTTARIEDIDRRIAEAPHSYFPVCEGELDKVIGIVGVRDLYSARVSSSSLDLASLAKPPLYVPENITVLRLLKIFKKSHAGLALVLNEFGSVEGLVTLNDILEAVVGDLPAVTNQADWFLQREDGSWLVDGLMPLDELAERLGISRSSLGEEDVETLGGLARSALPDGPAPGRYFERDGLRIEVVDMDGARVDKLLVARKSGAGSELGE